MKTETRIQPYLVYGLQLDPETRCQHYHSEFDIIAIRFNCCDQFYACYDCHQQLADHSATRWPPEHFAEKAILCGNCNNILTIHEYLCKNHCPNCEAQFNPKCKNHWHFYFQTHSRE